MPSAHQPKVSILVPCYNVEKYISQCMDSIIAQTLKDIEIICINDGSKDNTLNIIQEYAAKDGRVKIIDKPNSGYGASMNIGLKAATGEYIGIVESDDWAEQEMFAELYNLAHQNEVEAVKGNYYRYWSRPTERNELVTAIPQKDVGHILNPIKEQGVFWCTPAIWSAIYKREFIEKNGIKFLETPGASYQDTAFNFKVWACADKIYLTDKAYLHYRQDNEQSSVKSSGKVYCVCDEYHEIERFIKERNLTEQLEKLVQRLKYTGYMWNFGRLTFPLSWQFLKVMRDEFSKAQKAQLLDKNIFGKRAYRKVKTIINYPQLALLKQQFKKLKTSLRESRMSKKERTSCIK